MSILLFVLVAACGRLPDYAQPQMYAQRNVETDDTGSFQYRELVRADFQAVSLSTDYMPYSHRIQARSCISIQPTADTRFQITGAEVAGRYFYIGSVVHIDFIALFNPRCSWWSPSVPALLWDYVLQHEQIHFALAELTARNLSAAICEELSERLVFGESYEQAELELIRLVADVSSMAMEKALAEHTRLDEETSLVYDPERQQFWYEYIIHMLAGGDSR